PIQNRFFFRALYSDDQLRQRVAFALHEILVVSGRDENQPSWMTPYLQILDTQAFGNFRQLLYDITVNPAMGNYLNMDQSSKTNPNENYAREILQLFSVGVDLLNSDGTPVLDGFGARVPTYDQAVVSGFSKVFTGWRFAAQPVPGVINYITPMVLNNSLHDNTSKQLLGTVLAARAAVDGEADLNAAIDNIFNHQNVGPYIGSQLIHHLVTSNPSPAYVGRVAAIFNDNGSGVRGDLGAVVRAILLDTEARGGAPAPNQDGHLREPVLFVAALLRAFNARAASGSGPSDGYLSTQISPMDQDLYRPPTVFSYFPADYDLPGSNLLGPEFGILSTGTTLRRANFVNTMAFSTIPISTNAPSGTSIDLATLKIISSDPNNLVEQLNRVLLHGAMSQQMKASVVQAVSAVAVSNTTLRAQTALYLVATSSQYQVEH
ncbi:MAG: DUF1800 family protein, partial [Thermoanaerobaculia bacterium]